MKTRAGACGFNSSSSNGYTAGSQVALLHLLYSQAYFISVNCGPPSKTMSRRISLSFVRMNFQPEMGLFLSTPLHIMGYLGALIVKVNNGIL